MSLIETISCRANFFKSRGYSHCCATGIGICFTLLSFFANGATDYQINQIRIAAESHITNSVIPPSGGQLIIEAAELDSRLKASDCPKPLVTSASSTKATRSNINVLVECIEDNWKVYVPVRLSVSVPLVTAARSLARGDVIAASDINNQYIELQRFRKAGFSDPHDVIGAKVKRAIRPGDVIEHGDVCVVCRNEKVIIKATKSGMTITTKGTALQDGTTGEQVRVKNDKSQRIIEAVVTNIAEVSVAF